MTFITLYIWVEGNDDVRFFTEIIVPFLHSKYATIMIQKWSKMKKEKIYNFIKSIKSMPCADYLFISDINNQPCISSKKENLQKIFKIIEKEKMLIIQKEIESWYLAGLNDESSKRLKIKTYEDTNTITKEMLNCQIPKKYNSRIDFLLEILKSYSLDIAIQKNTSLKYFLNKYDC